MTEEEIIHTECGKRVEECLCDNKSIQAVCCKCNKDVRFCLCDLEDANFDEMLKNRKKPTGYQLVWFPKYWYHIIPKNHGPWPGGDNKFVTYDWIITWGPFELRKWHNSEDRHSSK